MAQTLDQAIEHHRAGRLNEAEAIYRALLATNPQNPGALQMTGMLQLQRGQPAEAAATLRKAAAVAPNSPQVFLLLAQAARLTGSFAEAQAAATRAIAIRPQHPVGYNELGLALINQSKTAEAIQAFQRAVQCNPNYAEAHSNLGATYAQQKQFNEAVDSLQRAVDINPKYAPAHNNLAGALNELNRTEEATNHWRKAVELDPNFFDALVNIAKVLDHPKDRPEAEEFINRAIALKPNDPHARFLRGLIVLERGDLQKGFIDYEYRLQSKDFNLKARKFPQPVWDGGEVAGKTFLLHAEQGLGDTIQFIRYAPLLAERGARIIVESPNELADLIRSVPGVSEVFLRGQPVPPFDIHASVVSLPMLFKTELTTIHATIPYITAPPDRVEQWKNRLGDRTNKKRIGIVWAGNPTHTNDKNRSIPLSAFADLAKIKNATFLSLQKGEAANQIATANLGFDLIEHTKHLHDLSDTAAIIAQLDLVITVDTSVAHVAGAQGKPVWTLLPFVPDWRWMQNRDDTPWYPTMRLFRQPTRRDWHTVIYDVATALNLD